MKKVLLSLIIAVLSFHEQVKAQPKKNITTQRLIWLAYNNKIRFNDKWLLNTEVEDRRYAFPDRQHEWILPRVTVIRELAPGWTAGIGFAHFRQSSPENPESDVSFVRPEFRPHQELNYNPKSAGGRFSIGHRYKLEERFLHNTATGGLVEGYTFNFRIRYRAQVSCLLSRNESGRGALIARAYDEFMLNFGKRVVYNSFDQNRLGLALNYALRKNLQFQVDFFNVFKQRSSGDEYYNQYVERFTLYHIIDISEQ